jgi:hypothetical protein
MLTVTQLLAVLEDPTDMALALHDAVVEEEPLDDDELCLLQLCEATSRRIASLDAPTDFNGYLRLQGTVEGQLLRESMEDEVRTMINEGKVVARDKRLIANFHELDGKWVMKFKKKLGGLLDRVRSRWTLRGDRQVA